jgi:hypothetical protein
VAIERLRVAGRRTCHQHQRKRRVQGEDILIAAMSIRSRRRSGNLPPKRDENELILVEASSTNHRNGHAAIVNANINPYWVRARPVCYAVRSWPTIVQIRLLPMGQVTDMVSRFWTFNKAVCELMR